MLANIIDKRKNSFCINVDAELNPSYFHNKHENASRFGTPKECWDKPAFDFVSMQIKHATVEEIVILCSKFDFSITATLYDVDTLDIFLIRHF